MALSIYGSHRSRTMRVLWMAAELDLEYTHVPLAFDDAKLKEPDFLAISPNGAIPAIVDDGFALAESLAINLYLAKKYGAHGTMPLYPDTLEREALAWRWSLWAQGHLEPWVQRDALLKELRAAIGDHGHTAIAKALSYLDETLRHRSWLVCGNFTVADLNVAAVLSPSRAENLPLDSYPHVIDWLARCYGRPASVATRKRFSK